MVDTTFEATYAQEIVAKYSSRVFPATMSVATRARYVGPSIKTEVRALGVQHFGVFAEPETTLLHQFQSSNGSQAFDDAVRFAEERGLPWSISGGADVFEPSSGCRWTHHRYGNGVDYRVHAAVRRVLGMEVTVLTAVEPGQTYRGDAILVDGEYLVQKTGDREAVVHRRRDLGPLPLDDDDENRPYKLQGAPLMVAYDVARLGTVTYDFEALRLRSARHDAMEAEERETFARFAVAFVKCDAMSVEFLGSLGATLSGDYDPDKHGVDVYVGDEVLAKIREFPADFTVQPVRPYATTADREAAISRVQAAADKAGLDAALPALRDAAEFGAPEWAIAAAVPCGAGVVAEMAERYAGINGGERQELSSEMAPIPQSPRASAAQDLNP